MHKWNKAMTVDGWVGADELGVTYVHEHLMVKPQLDEPRFADYTLQNERASTREAESFREAGGKTIVEMTPINYGRDPAACKRIAHAAGIQVICCTGFHKQEFMPPWFGEKNDEELYGLLLNDMENGMDGTGIHPGVIKFGTSLNEITPNEERSIRLAARAHLETGIPVSTHCDKGTMGMQQLDRLEKLGVDPSDVLLCHIDSKLDARYAIDLCRRGANICFDHVGRELADHDRVRVKMILELLEAGCIDHITLSGDMGKVNYLPAYGGRPGLAYILTGLRRELMHYLSENEFDRMVVENPRRFFTGQ
ncbi:phosphotriesterase [Caproicibacter fermentans]|uniref:Aryldialkylphosphatase n=2 Tax=Caproicibacter fermentans TaxID=2576756 RepID=A0A7G8TAZ6_9FIRM|nr:aryldialkylphosphatase [Caproicibacter fermentans]QNK40787.1 aryldialkylphosphatase [Caproicibacter fermentans]